jgi:CRP/FNR family transcriptional regulator, cyclic AMP receptor protein
MDERSLRSIPLFASLSRDERARVASCSDEVDVRQDEVLVLEGAFAYEFFVIREGTAEVRRKGEHVAQLGPGDFLGETGALTKTRRNASVIAQCPMRVIVMTARDLRIIDHEIPVVAQQLRDAIIDRAQVLTG